MSRRNTSSRVPRRTSTFTGSRPLAGDGRDRRVTLVGVEQQTVRKRLDPLGEVGQLAGHALAFTGTEPQLDDLPGASSER